MDLASDGHNGREVSHNTGHGNIPRDYHVAQVKPRFCIYCGTYAMDGAIICKDCYEREIATADRKVSTSLWLGLAAMILSLPSAIMIFLWIYYELDPSRGSLNYIFPRLSLLMIAAGFALGFGSIMYSRTSVKRLAALIPGSDQREIRSLLRAGMLGRSLGIVTIALSLLSIAAFTAFGILFIMLVIEWMSKG